MRSWMLLLPSLVLAGCDRSGLCDPEDPGCDVGADTSTADTDVDTDVDTDTDTDSDTEPPPEPVFYDSDEVVFELQQPVAWVPLEWEQELYSGEVLGEDVSFTLGAQVTGTTDLSLTVDSLLEEQTAVSGDWEQWFDGRKDGGNLDATVAIDFPMTVTISGLSIDISEQVLDLAGDLPELDWTFDTHVFDTLNLAGDGDSTTYVASPYEWSWSSPTIDPASWAPYVQIDLDAEVDFTSTFEVLRYDLADEVDQAIGSQTQASDRADVGTWLAPVGDEPAQVEFEGDTQGQLFNDLTLEVTVTVTLWYSCCTPVELVLPETIDLADSTAWKVDFPEEIVLHPQTQQ